MEENDSQVMILTKVSVARKKETGMMEDRMLTLLYKQKIDIVNKVQKTQYFVSIVSTDTEGNWQPKNVLAITGMPPE